MGRSGMIQRRMRPRPTISAVLSVVLACGLLACGSSKKPASTPAATVPDLTDLSRKCKQSPAELTTLINQGRSRGLHESAAEIAKSLDAIVTRLIKNGEHASCKGLMGALVSSSLEQPQP
ncbi:MAG: hypothetical protein JWM66_654 [Solirubrobacterales bacterium]|jgi:hypothetical protein|nr:hypothetical protein [Solirubrobacterales bacterium]